MSKRKHNIAYIKPEEPNFLKAMKEQIGYKEGPTVNTKREELDSASDTEHDDHDGEKPVVVVLKDGDLTAEEAEAFQKKKEEEEANAPADLSKKIIFNKPKSKTNDPEKVTVPETKRPKKSKPKKALLSFDDDEEEF